MLRPVARNAAVVPPAIFLVTVRQPDWDRQADPDAASVPTPYNGRIREYFFENIEPCQAYRSTYRGWFNQPGLHGSGTPANQIEPLRLRNQQCQDRSEEHTSELQSP